MSRARITIAQLAREGGIDPELAVLELMERGFKVQSERQYVPRSKLALARRTLALPQRPPTRAPVNTNEATAPSHSPVAEVTSHALVAQSPTVVKKRKPPKRPRRLDGPFEWKAVGRSQHVALVSEEDVNAIHWALVDEFRRSRDPIDPPRLRSEQLLASAVMRPYTALGGIRKYPSLAMSAAALFHALVLDHPFHNGNKRTALVSLLVLLDKNEHVLRAGEDVLYDYVVAVADHRVCAAPTKRDAYQADREMLEIARWIQGHMRRLERAAFRLQFRQLRKILSAFGCACEKVPGSRMHIRRGSFHTKIYYVDEGRDIGVGTIKKIRADLQLDDDHGYDSTIFYKSGRTYSRVHYSLSADTGTPSQGLTSTTVTTA
jgi:death-on-curing family protein